jgi:hypothetical protein
LNNVSSASKRSKELDLDELTLKIFTFRKAIESNTEGRINRTAKSICFCRGRAKAETLLERDSFWDQKLALIKILPWNCRSLSSLRLTVVERTTTVLE